MADAASPYEEPLDLPGGEQVPHTPLPPRPRKSRKHLLIGIAVVVVVLGAGLAAWKLLGKKSTPSQQTNQPATTTPATKTDTLPVTTQTKHFTAETLAVEFDYPANWTVTEKDGTISVKSPNFSYEGLNGNTTDGFFKLYIRKMARDIDSKYIGRAVALKATEPLTYTSPATSQRKTTNLSFFGYDDANNFAFFMITGNFNLKKGDTLGASYGKEADTFIIVGGYAATDSKDDLSFHQLAPGSFQNPAAYKQAIDILKSLKVS